MAKDARTGRFDVLLVRALDRLSRQGVAATLGIVERLGREGVAVWSLQESWTEAGSPALRELLMSIAAWVAREESERRSERTRAGLERARANGKVLGRPKGQGDTKQRRRRWHRRPE